MEKRSDRPCKPHKMAFPSFNVSELHGMSGEGKRFRTCKRCGWVIRDRSRDITDKNYDDMPCEKHKVASLDPDVVSVRGFKVYRCKTCGWFAGVR